MYSRAIQLNNAVLSYDVQGQGSRAMLMFHGAGQDRSVFHQLPSSILTSYRIYSFDLFFHGQSFWHGDNPISKRDWASLLHKFFINEQVDAVSVFGYSLGARFALATLEAFPEQVTDCYLVAPDGLVSSPWFNLATGTAVGRGFFKRLMDHPARLHQLFRLGSSLRVMDSSTLRFLEHQLDSDQKRARTYQTWANFRLLRFKRSGLLKIISTRQIRFVVFVAARDRIVPMGAIRTFLKRLKSAQLEVVDSNHRRVLTEAISRIGMR